MTSSEIRSKFLEFFKSKGHAIIPSASLVPADTDPTALFTTAGMHPLVPYLLGEKHPLGHRLADSQKCVRTGDIDEVGDNSHLTFFEMLGNWSLGDPSSPDGIGAGYFKKEAIEWSWEFLTDKKWLGLDSSKIAVSVFAGDDDAPRDDEAAEKWLEVSGDVLKGRIDYLPKNKNWWGPAGQTGPCGPDTEIFYWTGSEPAPKEIKAGDLADHPSWMEIWNNVFMQYNKNADGKYVPLAQKNVDTGMGLERLAMVMQGKDNAYDTDLFAPIMEQIKSLGTSSSKLEERIIADHIKASVFIIADGVDPSNTGAGYVLRRLSRRIARCGKKINLEINSDFLNEAVNVVASIYENVYPEVKNNQVKILAELNKEVEKFQKPMDWLDQYRKDLQEAIEYKIIKKITSGAPILVDSTTASGEYVYENYQSYGVPYDLSQDIVKEMGLKFDQESFDREMKKHQELSKTASAGMFKGGLADAGEQTTKYHTATHLLLAAMREILGKETYQKGSNITAERLRFDFNYPQKLTDEQIKKIEDLVNVKIQENLPVEMMEMPKEEALKIAKVSFDPAKYGDVVKVYKIGDPSVSSGQAFSIELCGGPHVKNTGELGKFKITKEEASAAGVRRIKAILS